MMISNNRKTMLPMYPEDSFKRYTSNFFSMVVILKGNRELDRERHSNYLISDITSI